ncbi:MAG TPA: hypothetical protein VN922_22285, partial [Bacteroidia bacterium]|nr:hypothetical protein [Bacteroidia bacterium]
MKVKTRSGTDSIIALTSIWQIVLLGEVAHIMCTRKYIIKDKIEKIAIERYRQNGLGITFEDIKKEFLINKRKAQRTLKYLHEGDIIFTASDLISEGINILQNKSPQQYFPTCIKAVIIEDLGKRKNVL